MGWGASSVTHRIIEFPLPRMDHPSRAGTKLLRVRAGAPAWQKVRSLSPPWDKATDCLRDIQVDYDLLEVGHEVELPATGLTRKCYPASRG